MQAAQAQQTVGRHSFPRRSRLLKPSEFKIVFDQAVVSSDRLFRVFARVAETPQSRLGIAVSRKVDARASVRNRIRRVVRESFRLHHAPGERGDERGTAAESSAKDYARDYVVLATPPAAAAANAELSASLSHHWREIDHKLARRHANPLTARGQRPGQKE